MRLFAAAFATILLVPGAATAAPQPPVGFLCNITQENVPGHGGYAELHAALVLADDDPAAGPVWGSVTCTIQDSWQRGTAVLASATSPTAPGAAVLAPTLVPYVDDDGYDFLCSRVDVVGGPTWYWDRDADGWSTDPRTPCPPFGEPDECEPFADPPCQPIDVVIHTVEMQLDAVLCPVLAEVYPPQGDVEGVWDCPPYGS